MNPGRDVRDDQSNTHTSVVTHAAPAQRQGSGGMSRVENRDSLPTRVHHNFYQLRARLMWFVLPRRAMRKYGLPCWHGTYGGCDKGITFD